MSIEQLKKKLESEREKDANSGHYVEGESCSYYMNEIEAYKDGHEAATNRLLPLLEKAVEMVKFVDLNTSLCLDHRRNQDIPFCSYSECDIKIKAREFLSEFTKMAEIKK